MSVTGDYGGSIMLEVIGLLVNEHRLRINERRLHV